MPPETNQGLDPYAFAANARTLILEQPRNYAAFGAYWFLVKALLKKVYPSAEVPLLGDYVDQSVVDRMPKGLVLSELLELAGEEYAANMRLGTPTTRLEDPEDGEFFTLSDPDMGG
ncbi:MAG TPA: hypothetical protein VJP88_00230 [Caulobacteraceae bacterium]|nr:hypothetical protein [Caulobacteraceae bacterium]